MQRRIQKILTQDFGKKIQLLSGPRQVGKTTLSQLITERRRKAPGFSYGDISRRCPAELGTTSLISMCRAFLL